MSIIEVSNVVKRYRLGQVHGLRASVKRLLHARSAPPRNDFNALDGINFSVEAGEVLGIIGTNGAGKSTLLKVLAGITTPTTGRMTARGRIAPLIEVGAGLIADLTGRENIYLNGVILGMSVKEIRRKFDDIVAFAELEKFIDTPIKRYSSGMAVRLGFSIATAVECEILIVDEVLAVGDIAFQRKCFDRIEDIIRKQGRTILLVSHNIRQVERLCTRAILLEHGRIVVDGATRDVCQQFYERTNAKVRAMTASNRKSVDAATPSEKRDIDLLDIGLLDASGEPTQIVPFQADLAVRITFRVHSPLRRLLFGVGVHTSDMLYLATHSSAMQLDIDRLEPGDYTIRCAIRRPPLVPGVYSLRLGISEGDFLAQAYYGENLTHFQISAADADAVVQTGVDGFFALDGQWLAPQLVSHETRELEAA